MGYVKSEDRLRSTMQFVIRFIRKNGFPPSVREICKGVGVKSASHAQKLLDQLEERGLISREQNKYRSLKVLEQAYTFVDRAITRVEEILMIPVVGKIVASLPVPVPSSSSAYYDPESAVPVSRSAFREHEQTEKLFALEVEGDSMIDSMVNDGDIVILRPVQEADNGEMVAVWLEDREETTLKHFYKKNGQIILRPANPTMKDIVIKNPAAVKLQGKVILVMRRPN